MSDLTLTDRLHDVAEARHKLTALKQTEQELERIVAGNLEYQLWQDALRRRRSQEGEVALAEQVAREQAIHAYLTTGDKAPAQGITLQHFTVVNYDPAAATNWCRTQMPGLLVLDGKRFEKAVKEGLALGSPAQIVDDVRAQLAADLSSYLE